MKLNRGCLGLLAFVLLLCARAVAQPGAAFSATPTSGCAPLNVQFTDNSTGNPTSWKWDFGNGTVSTQRNPAITYYTGGKFTVKLTVTNSSGSNTIEKTQYITVYDKPVVKFRVSDSSNCVPFTTRFTDLSTVSVGTITGWLWYFDDGTTSTLASPQHAYNLPGNYNITLKVTSSGGCSSSLSKLSYIKAADSIRSQFSFTPPTQCKPPETIRFTNNTLGPGTLSYKWDFGDGSSSTQTSPSHIYTNGGAYTIQLMVSNNLGCKDTLTKIDTVVIKNVRSAISGPDTICTGLRAIFRNTTTPVPFSSKWIFSDGVTSFGPITARTWQAPGTYTVKLVSNFSTCSDSITKRVVVLAPPAVRFSSNDSASCKPPFNVQFTDLTGDAINWQWNFGDGNSSTLQHPSHTYTLEGEFAVSLTITNRAGCQRTLSQNRFIKILPPVVSFNAGEGGGCIPFAFKPVPTVTAVDGVSSYLWDFGNGNISNSILPTQLYTDSGTYTVKLTVTTNDGCVDSVSIPDAVRTGRPPVVNFDATPVVTCPGKTVQFRDLSVPADRWLWYFGDGSSITDQNPNHTYSDTFRYSVKLIVWNNGCKDSLIRLRYITTLPGLARFRPIYNCSNKLQVSFKDSSILPQSWTWNFGDGTSSTSTNPTHQYSQYGSYIVSLTTTNNSCTYTSTVPVRLMNIIPFFSLSKDSICKGDSILFRLQNTDSVNTTKYSWNFGDGSIDTVSRTSVSHTFSNAGIYNVQLSVTDKYGCVETSQVYQVHVYAPRAGFSVINSGRCINKALQFTDTSSANWGPNNIVQWKWDFGDGTRNTFNNNLPNPLTHVYRLAGNFFPSLVITDDRGCSDSISYPASVTIYQPTANFFAPNYFTCTADTLQLRNASTGTQLTYAWDFGDGTSSTALLPIKQYTTNGDYTIKLVVTDRYGCQDSMIKPNYAKVKTVTADFSASDTTGTCTPFEIRFRNLSSNALSQIWDFGDGGFSSTSNPTYSYFNPGTYQVVLTARRSANCFSSDTLPVLIRAPRANLTYAPVTGCMPLKVAFHVQSADSVSYIWDFNDGTSIWSYDSVFTHTYADTGYYLPSVIVKDTSGCIYPLSGTDSIFVRGNKIDFNSSDSFFCNNGTAQFNATIKSTGTVSNYHWNFGDGGSSTQASPAHLYNSPGRYPVQLTVTSSQGCTDSLLRNNYIVVASRPSFRISGNDDRYCGTASVSMQAQLLVQDTGSISWSWTFGNGNTSNLQNPPTQLYVNRGQYIIRANASSMNGCSDSASASFDLYPNPLTEAGDNVRLCEGSTLQLIATGADQYTWSPATALSCTSCSNPVTNTSTDITYYVKGSNLFGCTTSDSVRVLVKRPFVLSGLPASASICDNETLALQVSGAEIYSWSPATALSNASIPNPVASPDNNITYTVTASDSARCFSNTASINVTVYPAPKVAAGADIITNSGNVITLQPQYAGSISSWLWEPASGLSCYTCPNPVASPLFGTTYTITVANSNGCKSSDQIFVQLKCDRSSLFIPTAFTPDNNNLNEYFYPRSNYPVIINSFRIFNRLGELVYQAGNFRSNDRTKGWDGRHKGVPAAVGNYMYAIEFICGDGSLVSFNGNILLIR